MNGRPNRKTLWEILQVTLLFHLIFMEQLAHQSLVELDLV